MSGPRLLWVAMLVALAGCGSGGSGSSSSGGSHQAASGAKAAHAQPAAPGVAVGAPNGEASRSPAQIIQDTVAALDRVHSFHLAGTQTAPDGKTTLHGDIVIPGRLHMTLTQGRGVAEIIVIDGQGYLRANRAFYATRAGASTRLLSLLANRWIAEPANATPGSIFDALTSAATVGHCLVASHLGSLSVAGTSTVRGQPVVIVADHGGAPGTAPGRLFVATTGPPLPLLGVQTARSVPGGSPDTRCNETRRDVLAPSNSSRFAISAYNHPVSISAPAGALDLSTLVPGSRV